MDDLNTVLHLTEYWMVGPASSSLSHDPFPIVLEPLKNYLAFFIADIDGVADGDVGLLANMLGNRYSVPPCYFDLKYYVRNPLVE